MGLGADTIRALTAARPPKLRIGSRVLVPTFPTSRASYKAKVVELTEDGEQCEVEFQNGSRDTYPASEVKLLLAEPPELLYRRWGFFFRWG